MENCKIVAWRACFHTGYEGADPGKWVYCDGEAGERFVREALAYKTFDPKTGEGLEVEALGVIPLGVLGTSNDQQHGGA